MEIIRKIGKFELIYEPLQRMYIVKKGTKTSLWFDSHTKEELIIANEINFIKKCKEFLENQ